MNFDAIDAWFLSEGFESFRQIVGVFMLVCGLAALVGLWVKRKAGTPKPRVAMRVFQYLSVVFFSWFGVIALGWISCTPEVGNATVVFSIIVFLFGWLLGDCREGEKLFGL